jgi:TorA maturation chaperone TorD
MIEKELLLEWLQGRQLVYQLLARLYQEEPQKEILATMRQESFLEEMAKGSDNPNLVAGCRLMEAELDSRGSELQAYQQELQEDYNRLFVGPGHLEAPPWESVYRSKEHLLFGEETLAVREFYRSFGLESKKKNREPDDHLGLEMEFMAWLSQAAAAKVQAGEDATEFLQGQQRFLKEHLEQWVPALCSDIQGAARTEFFRGLALFTRGWLEADAAELEAVLEDFCGGEKS